MTDTDITPIRAKRVAAVDAKLIAKHGDDPAALAAAIRRHPVRHDSSYVAELEAGRQRVSEVHEVMFRVLSKFPSETVPTSLRWVRHALKVSWMINGAMLVVTCDSFFGQQLKGEFPLRLLDAQESEIAAWTRTRYWESVNKAKAEAREAARRDLVRRRARVDQLRRELAAAERAVASSVSAG